jgi:hypothetical protein
VQIFMCTLKVFVKPGGLRRFHVNSRAKGKSSTKFSTEIAHFSKKSNNFYVGHFFHLRSSSTRLAASQPCKTDELGHEGIGKKKIFSLLQNIRCF